MIQNAGFVVNKNNISISIKVQKCFSFFESQSVSYEVFMSEMLLSINRDSIPFFESQNSVILNHEIENVISLKLMRGDPCHNSATGVIVAR